MSTTPTTQPDLRFDLSDYQDIADQPQVYETIRALLDDHTEDNATCMVRAVIEAAHEQLLKLTQAQVEPRCERCNYQHGHAIGCEKNPVDIALKDGRTDVLASGCTCPSGDGSLRWPCPTHRQPAQGVAAGWVPTVLYGPRTSVCWTPDRTPKDQRVSVVLISEADYLQACQLLAAAPQATPGPQTVREPLTASQLHTVKCMDSWAEARGLPLYSELAGITKEGA